MTPTQTFISKCTYKKKIEKSFFNQEEEFNQMSVVEYLRYDNYVLYVCAFISKCSARYVYELVEYKWKK